MAVISHPTLGLRIRELRSKEALSREQLSKRSGLTRQMLTDIENGKASLASYEDIVKIADGLRISAEEYIYLLRLIKSKRHFQVYNVGILKTGTFSIYGLFGRYRSYHAWLGFENKPSQALLSILPQYTAGKISKGRMRKIIRQRDNEHLLEMDSSFFNYAYLDILTEEFPHAKFIFTIRDVYSWLDSFLNWYLRFHPKTTEKGIQLMEALMGTRLAPIKRLKRSREGERDLRSPGLVQTIEALIRYWARSNENIIRQLPSSRSLMIRTHEISENLGRIAGFIGIPETALEVRKKHENKNTQKYRGLKRLDKTFLQKTFEKHASSLMKLYFPGYTFDHFLNAAE